MTPKRLGRRTGCVRKLAGEKLKQRDTQAEHVAAEVVTRFGAAKLGGQVVHGVKDVARLQQRGFFAGMMGETQVEQHRLTVSDQADVVRLHVAMNESLA